MAGASLVQLHRLRMPDRCRWCNFICVMILILSSAVAGTIYPLKGKLVVLNEPRKGQQLLGNMTYYFRTVADATLYSLVLSPQVPLPEEGLKTGDGVVLSVDLDLSGAIPEAASAGAKPSGAPGTLYVLSWSGDPSFGSGSGSGSGGVYYSGEGTLALRTAVWVVGSMCGQPVRGGVTVQDVSEILFGPAPGAALSQPRTTMTLNRWWDTCSYGAVQMKRSDVTLLELSLPCSGVRPNGAVWNVTRGSPPSLSILSAANNMCGTDEVWGWMEYASAVAEQQGDIDPALPYRRVLLLPPTGWWSELPYNDNDTTATGGLCRVGWQQWGSYGCDGRFGCDMWIKADRTSLATRLLTQLGSSMALPPAMSALPAATSTSSSPPASTAATDPTCPMGSATGTGEYSCFNGPHSFKLLFSRPLLPILDSTTTLPVFPVSVQLPAAATSPANQLLVVPNWISPTTTTVESPYYTLYSQYRAPVGGDAGLPAALRGRLVIHGVAAATPPAGPAAAPASVLLAALAPGESYRYDAAQVLVRFQERTLPSPASDPGGVTGGSAVVTVCRYLATTEDVHGGCWDGLDNDCDGLVDFDDPDCFTAFGRHHHHH